jgi:LysM repeat protein
MMDPDTHDEIEVSAARRRQRMRQRQHQRTREQRIRGSFERPNLPDVGGWLQVAFQRLHLDQLEVRHLPFMAAAAVVLVLVIFLASHLLGGRIFPNVFALDVPIGDLTVEEAVQKLQAAWRSDLRITLRDGDRTWTADPTEMGLQLDARQMAEGARAAGLAGFPFGYWVEPVVTLDRSRAEAFFLDLHGEVDIAPINARYTWQAGEVVGVAGVDGRQLDTADTLDMLVAQPVLAVRERTFELWVDAVAPAVADPAPLLENVRALTAQPFELRGYDPFYDLSTIWTTTPDVFTSWLEASEDGLTLREDTFAPFVLAQNATLQTNDPPRYLDANETMGFVRDAIQAGESSATLRVRQRETTYTVVSGDSAYRVARKTGLPYYLFEAANPDRDLSVLSIGDTLNVPSRDPMVPLPPVADKRIIVDLDRQMLVAYENGSEVFRWAISSGVDDAPTSPGIFQILDHSEVAYGSSYTLCNSEGCGQWEMYWFMGIYEVVPGLMNGFHGAVLLPNGAYLGGGNVGSPFTFGCVMSQDDQARLLYDWAEEGTIVEIISSDYPPQSELARRAFA